MAQSKTEKTDASVEAYIAARASDEQRVDCKALTALFVKLTQHQPKMWGPSIVGFGSYRYTYASGRTGESCLTGFAIRGRELVVYLSCEGSAPDALLAKLGKHRKTKACLYFKRLADLDQGVLEQLVVNSIQEVEGLYGQTGGA